MWLILGLEQDIYKMSLEHIVVPESKEILKQNKMKRNPTKNKPKEKIREGIVKIA